MRCKNGHPVTFVGAESLEIDIDPEEGNREIEKLSDALYVAYNRIQELEGAIKQDNYARLSAAMKDITNSKLKIETALEPYYEEIETRRIQELKEKFYSEGGLMRWLEAKD